MEDLKNLLGLDTNDIIRNEGISVEDAQKIIEANDPQLWQIIWHAAGELRNILHGNFLEGYAPIYLSNFCVSRCKYCPYQVENGEMYRRRLTLEEVRKEIDEFVDIGHRKVCILAGNDPKLTPEYYSSAANHAFDHHGICEVIFNIDGVPHGDFSYENLFKLIKKSEGKKLQFRVFQETYHRPTFETLHNKGVKWTKRNFDYRRNQQFMAADAGADSVGIGMLLGLYNWKYDLLEMIEHGKELKSRGYPLETISTPRFQEALGVDYEPEYEVPDEDLPKIQSLLKLSFPKQHIIVTSRETPESMNRSYKVCTITDVEARPWVGAYSDIGDSRYGQISHIKNPMGFNEFIENFKKLGYQPVCCFDHKKFL